jgi:hypothetical protein
VGIPKTNNYVPLDGWRERERERVFVYTQAYLAYIHPSNVKEEKT